MKLTDAQFRCLVDIASGRMECTTHYMLRILRAKRLVRKSAIELTSKGNSLLWRAECIELTYGGAR